MSFISNEVIAQTIGAVVPGDPGLLGVHHVVTGGAQSNGASIPAYAEVDKSSLARAEAQNAASAPYNGKYAPLRNAAASTALNAAPAVSGRSQQMDGRYASLVASQPGLIETVDRVMSRAPQMKSASGKGPLARVQAMHRARVARQLKMVPNQKAVSVNPESLPEAEKLRIIEEALAQGQTMTALGPLPSNPRRASSDRKSYAALRQPAAVVQQTPRRQPAPVATLNARGLEPPNLMIRRRKLLELAA